MKKTFLIVSLLFFNYIVFAQSYSSKIDSLIKAYISLNKFNGTVLVTKNGKVVFNKSYGYGDVTNKRLITSKSIFQIGSLTKPFTALLILKIFDEKKISINEPLSKFIINYPKGSEITIKHLLTHTSGIYEALQDPNYFELLTASKQLTNEERISFFCNKPLSFTPGSKFSYSNSGYDLLGAVIEKLSGLTYQECLKKYIFEPLKMQNSGFDYRALNDKKRKVTGYSYLSKTRQIESKLWNPYAIFSSGALYSTTGDLLKFYSGLKSYRIVSREVYESAVTPFLNGYGLGWYIDSIGKDLVINHGGNIDGFTSYYLMNHQNDICIILLNNITSTSLERIGNSIYKILTNMPYILPKPKLEVPVKQEILSSYVGRYEISENYIATISLENSLLFLQINNETKMKLSAEKETVFFIKDEDMEIEFVPQKNTSFQLKIRQGLSTKIGDKIK
ncbi:serine hydrolase [Lacibacter sp.]|uniref:serine hydrolase n=1 Tax=Lacibacter sp. TaxID=1915409 RepID=UPI002B4AF7AE|nr:serine hydrolase [Lacibacter sp.]HLP38962.1 serine hydrolase [Lacibacter sp.]